MFTAALVTAFLSAPAYATVMVAQIEGMSCFNCATKIKDSLEDLEFIREADVSFSQSRACADLTGPIVEAAVHQAIVDLGYKVVALTEAERCPDPSTSRRNNWADVEGLDAQVISRGEKVDVTAHLAEGRFTIVDFGAIWCAPCHAAEALIKAYISDHADTAVRAIVLTGDEPDTSFGHPVAHQYLSAAPGLPYFIVYDGRGKVIYRGVDVVKVLQKIDKKR